VRGTGLVAGFYGKLPARGDFVRFGLPRAFTDPWDDWLREAIAGSRERMGDDWLPAYLEAAIWRFALPPGLCGSLPVVGTMLPSVDKAGRYFPLTFAALCDRHEGVDAWLDRCEDAGLAALEQDTPPDAIAASIGLPDVALHDRDRDGAASCDSIWWTEGAPRVLPTRLIFQGMPDVAAYTAMLGDITEPVASGPMEEASWELPS
jgi:type VI secretion system protein ImpM